MEDELKLQKDVRLSTTLLVLGLADRVGERAKLESLLLCHLCKLPCPKVRALETKPDQDAKQWNPGKSEDSEKAYTTGIESKTDDTPCAVGPLSQRDTKAHNCLHRQDNSPLRETLMMRDYRAAK